MTSPVLRFPAELQAALLGHLPAYQDYLQSLHQHLLDPFGLNSFASTDQGGLFVENPLLEYYTETDPETGEVKRDPQTGQPIIKTREHQLQGVQDKQHLVIVGGGGEGKSTILKHLAYHQALTNSQTLPLFLSLNALAYAPIGNTPAAFSELAEYLDQNPTYFGYVHTCFAYWQAVHPELASSFQTWLLHMLHNQQVKLYLDGWDETPPAARQRLQHWLQALQHTRLPIIISARFKEQLPFQGFETWTVTFDFERQKQYVRAFFSRQQAPDTANEVIEYLRSAPQVLCKPLFLTLLCEYWQARPQELQTPTELMQFFTEQIFAKWPAQKSLVQSELYQYLCDQTETPSEQVERLPVRLIPFMAYLAFQAQCSSQALSATRFIEWLQVLLEQSALTERQIGRNRSIQALRTLLQNDYLRIEAEAADWLKALTQTGLLQLIPGQRTEYSFAHRAFQEYLCARFMHHNMPLDELNFFFSNKRFERLAANSPTDDLRAWPFKILSVEAPHHPPNTWCWDFIQQPFALSQELKDYALQQNIILPHTVNLYPVMFFSNQDWQETLRYVFSLNPNLWLQQWERLQHLRQVADSHASIPFNSNGYWVSKDLECLFDHEFLPEKVINSLSVEFNLGLQSKEEEWVDFLKLISKQHCISDDIKKIIQIGLSHEESHVRAGCKGLLSKKNDFSSKLKNILIKTPENDDAIVKLFSAEESVAWHQWDDDLDLPEKTIRCLVDKIKDKNRSDKIKEACTYILRHQYFSEQIIRILVDEIIGSFNSYCVEALGERCLPRQAVDSLIEGLNSKDLAVRRVCTWVFSNQNHLSEKTLKALSFTLKDIDPQVRYACAIALLKNHANLTEESIRLLIEGLNDEEFLVRLTCAYALGNQPYLPEKVIVFLIEKIKSSVISRFDWAQALGLQSNLPEKAISYLINELQVEEYDSNSIRIKQAYLQVLSKQSYLPEKVIDFLVKGLKNDFIGYYCAVTLVNQQKVPEYAIFALINELKNDYIRSACRDELGSKFHLSEPLIDALLDGLNNEDESVQMACIEILGKKSDLSEKAVFSLIEDFYFGREMLCQAAIEALSNQTYLPEEAILYFLYQIDSEHRSIRSSSAKALNKHLSLSRLIQLITLQKYNSFTEYKEEIICKLEPQKIHELLAAQAINLI